MAFLSPMPSFEALSAQRCGFEGPGVMQHLWSTWKTTQAFAFHSLPKITRGRDLAWAYLLPQCLLALVWLWGWSPRVVTGTWQVVRWGLRNLPLLSSLNILPLCHQTPASLDL